MIYKQKILDYIKEPKTIKEISNYLDANYHTVKNTLSNMRTEGLLYAYKDNQTRLMNYYIPQPHPLQIIFGHTANFTDDQIKSITIHNADDSKHNLQHKTTQETYGESVAYTLTRYD